MWEVSGPYLAISNLINEVKGDLSLFVIMYCEICFIFTLRGICFLYQLKGQVSIVNS